MATSTRPKTSKRSSTRRRQTPPDAIAVLKDDHREVEKLFAQFERTSDNAHRERRQLVDRMIAALSRHAEIEERILYPWMRDYIDNRHDEVLEALEEHRVVKWLLAELSSMDAEDERFGPRVTVMAESVRHHVKEEETELFKDLRAVATRTELQDLGAELLAAKQHAPTTPAVGARVASSIEHARDVGHDVVDRVGTLVGLE